MQPECSPQTSIHDISILLAQHPTVVVRSDTRRIGIVTARDVAAALHFGQGHMPCAVIARTVPRSGASAPALSVDWATLRASLTPALVSFLQQLADICNTQGAQLCLVGGVVRAVCRREELTDLDVCVVGPFDAVIDAIVTATGATILQRSTFATATLTFPVALQATVAMAAYDIVGARHETYATIGVLPTVTPVDDIRAFPSPACRRRDDCSARIIHHTREQQHFQRTDPRPPPAARRPERRTAAAGRGAAGQDGPPGTQD